MNEAPSSQLTASGSLASRLVALSLIWALVLLVLGVAALTFLFRQTVFNDLDDRLGRVSESLLAHVEVSEAGALSVGQQPTDPTYSQVFRGRYWQITMAGAPSDLASLSLAEERLPIRDLTARAVAAPGTLVTGDVQGPDGERLRVLVQAVRIDGASAPVVIAAGEDRRTADANVQRFLFSALGLFAAFAAALAMGVFLQVRFGLGPVLRMGRAVAAVRDGEQSRIDDVYPSELMPLADELNSLLDHSREVVERARTHVGNLAHALKTPITVLSNEARAQKGPLAELVTRQSDTMSNQVEHHLRRARAAANARAIGARASLNDVLEDLTRTLQKVYGRRGVRLDSQIDDDLVFRGERQDLEDLVGNLIDNACKWSGGLVRVSASLINPGKLEISIEDDGPGLSAAQCEQALARGVRLDEQAPGTGLGLAIVSDLARAYDGALQLDRSSLGGLRARLTLPAARRRGSETGR